MSLNLLQRFEAKFGHAPTVTATAPGRVNLIGEHIDYNCCAVLPKALDVSLTVALRPTTDDRIIVSSSSFDGEKTLHLDDKDYNHWAGHAVATIQLANEINLMHGGAEVMITSDIPDGAGVSSSAALIVAILKAIRSISSAEISDKEVAQLARRVETDYIGVPCGIMDQMAVALAEEQRAMLLDTRTLEFDLVDIPDQFLFVVVHSGQERVLSDGRYGERKKECDEIKSILNTDDLCHLSDAQSEKAKTLSPHLMRRARHCLSEHERVLAFAEGLRQADMQRCAELMKESHASMRDDFEMSTEVIDQLVEDSIACGAVGARLTGGGFGGCIVVLVERKNYPSWSRSILSEAPNARIVSPR